MRIILNGREAQLDRDALSYEDLVKLMGREYITVTYRMPRGQDGGSLSPGQTLDLAEGMIINAYVTGNA